MQYDSFGGPYGGYTTPITMNAYEGTNVALLIQPSMTEFSDPARINLMVGDLDKVYQFYATVTGRSPQQYGPTTLDGRDTVAILDKTGGAGFGEVGYTGIEVLNVAAPNNYGDVFYNGASQGITSNVFTYEFGRNFWLYGPQLGAADPFVGAFASANQWLAADYAGLTIQETSGPDAATTRQDQMVNLLRDYMADPTASWEALLAGGSYDAVQFAGQDFSATKEDVAGALYYKVYADWGMSGYAALWHAMASEPTASTADQAKANFLDAAEKATGADYSWFFKEAGTVSTVPSASDETTPSPTAPRDTSLAVPADVSAVSGQAAPVAGVSITDAFAAANAGTAALNVTTADGGTVSMTDASGQPISGSGTGGIHVQGTLAQLNAELATLSFTGTAADQITVDFWNQAGWETTKAVGVSVQSAPLAGTPQDTSIVVPATVQGVVGQPIRITGVTVNDLWSHGNPGTAALNVTTADGGAVSMVDGAGRPVPSTGTGSIHIQGTLAQLNTDLSTLVFTGAQSDQVTVDFWNQAGVETTKTLDVSVGNPPPPPPPTADPNDTTITAPSSDHVVYGQPSLIQSIGISDQWAAANPGAAALNVTTADGGTVSMVDPSGNPVPGSGTSGIHIQGSLAQLDANLATLAFTGTTDDVISVDFWNQAGVETTKPITALIDVFSVPPTASPASTTITATTGGTTITPGVGSRQVTLNSSHNAVLPGGSITITDNGTDNTLVIPAASQGFDDIVGDVFGNGDKLDLSKALGATTWNGALAMLGDYVHLTAGSGGTDILVSPSGSGPGTLVPTLHGVDMSDLGALLAHAVT